MAPKRKDPATEDASEASGPRRSTRTSTTTATSTSSAPPKKSAESAATKPASKGKTAAPKKEDKEHKPNKEDDKPASKKQKTDAEEPAKKDGGVLEVGSTVPDITLKNEDDEDTSLASLYAENGLVIFSYPKANTPGCTNQACGYRDIESEFKSLSYTVIGLSQDKPKAQKSWQQSKNLGYHLLCDPDRKLLKKLGATEAKKRCHWVIEKGGKLLEAKIGVKPADDPKNALDFIKSLK